MIFKAIPGFEQTMTNRQSIDEEIDLVVRNESTDAFWSKQGSYLLGECKNWSSAVDRKEFDAFRSKMARGAGQSKLNEAAARQASDAEHARPATSPRVEKS